MFLTTGKAERATIGERSIAKEGERTSTLPPRLNKGGEHISTLEGPP